MKTKTCCRCEMEFAPRSSNAKYCDDCRSIAHLEKAREYKKARSEKMCENWNKYYEANREILLERDHEYKAANREKIREYQRKHFEANREKICERKRELYIENRENIIKQHREWREANPEKVVESSHKYRDANREERNKQAREYHKKIYEEQPERFRIYQHNRRAREAGNGGSFTVDELQTLLDVQEALCFYCGRLLFESFDLTFHIEHKVPISRGGTNYIENIALSCVECNLKKHTKTAEEFLETVGGLS